MILILCLFPILLHYSVHITAIFNRTRVSHTEGWILVLVLSATLGIWLQSLTGIPAWEYVLVFLSAHYLVFDYLFDKEVLHKPWDYLGSNWLDTLEKKINPKVLLGIKIFLFLLSLIVLYI